MKWLLILLMIPAAALGTTHTVGQGGGADFTTIQAAVDAASDGDGILIQPGIYYENVVVPYPSINLGFWGEDVTTTIVDAGGSGKCFYFHFDGTGGGSISDLTLQNSGTGHEDGMSNGAIALRGGTDNCFLIRYCILRDNPYHAIVTEVETSASWCLFEDNLSSAVFVFGGCVSEIWRNTFINCETGVFIASDAEYCTIINNIFFDLSFRGIWCSEGANVAIYCNNMWNVNTPYHGCSPDFDDFSLDPLFCGNPPNGNYYLRSNSPCADENHVDCGQVGAYPVGCDETAAEALDWGGLKARY